MHGATEGGNKKSFGHDCYGNKGLSEPPSIYDKWCLGYFPQKKNLIKPRQCLDIYSVNKIFTNPG